MRNLATLSLVLLIPLAAFAADRKPDMSLVWTPEDQQLRVLTKRFKENFYKNERAYRAALKARRAEIAADTTLGPPQRTAKLKLAEQDYIRNSTLNVAKYREPLLERMKTVANRGIRSAERIADTQGEGLYIKTKNGVVLNPAYGGALSDKDMGAASLPANRFAKLVKRYFGNEVETVDGKKVLSVKTTAQTVDVKFLEATINTNPGYYDPRTGKFVSHDLVGSSSLEARYRSMANNPETYVGVSAAKLGRKQMVAYDHFAKTTKARRIPAAAHVDPAKLEKVRPLYKAAYKMAGNLNEAEFDKIKARTGYQGSFAAFKGQVEGLKKKASMDAVGLDRSNIARFKATAEAVQDEVLAKSKADWNRVEAAEAKAIRASESQLAKLGGEARGDKIREITKRRTALIDSRARMKALQAMADEARGRAPVHGPEKVRPIALTTKATARARINRKVEGWIAKGAPALGKVANGVQVVTATLRVGSKLYEGDIAGAVKETGAIAFEQATSRLHYAVAERIIPGYGNMAMAYDVGYGTGRVIGKYVKLYPGGPTVDQAAQNFFQKAYDTVSGNRQKRWNNQRLQDYQAYLNEMIDNWGAALPPGVTRGQAFAYAVDQDNKGGNFRTAMEKLFTAGDKYAAAREADHRELAGAVKDAALADAAASKAKEEADKAAASSGQSAGSGVGGLHDLLARKQQEANQASTAGDNGQGMNTMFDQGTATRAQYRKLERAKVELAEARAHLADVRARIAERERARAAENRAFLEGLAAFGQALGQAAQTYQRQQALASAPATSSPSSSESRPVQIGVARPDWDAAVGGSAGSSGFAGNWSTKEFGRMHLAVTGGRIAGTYGFKGGRINGNVAGSTMSGIWTQTSSNQRCSQERFGSWYWGGFDFRLGASGKAFTGTWDYCGNGRGGSWTGTRIAD